MAAATATAAAADSPSTPLKATMRRRFPADIEAEILAWLPVKTLKRFETACKSWSSLVSSPKFVKQHYSRAQTKPPRLFTLQSDQEDVHFKPDPSSIVGRYPSSRVSRPERNFMDLIFNCPKAVFHPFYNADKLTLRFSAYNTTLQGNLSLVNRFTKTLSQPLFDGSLAGKPFMLSSRGLLCIASWSLTNPPILICNPSTKELTSLPPTNEPNLRVGFGYVASTDEFKVVRFFNEGIKKKSRCQVLTLGTSNWRKARNLPYRACDGTAPFLHGAVHCLPETSRRGVQTTDAIVAFDIDIEDYREAIPMPPYYHTLGDCGKRQGICDVRNFMRLSLLGGSLCVTFDFGELKCRLEVWLLKDYHNVDWVKACSINVSSIYPYPSFSFWACPTDNLVDETILLNCSDEQGIKLLGYDPRNKGVTVKRNKEWAAAYCEETLYFPGSQ